MSMPEARARAAVFAYVAGGPDLLHHHLRSIGCDSVFVHHLATIAGEAVLLLAVGDDESDGLRDLDVYDQVVDWVTTGTVG
jgi:hypothetical protein